MIAQLNKDDFDNFISASEKIVIVKFYRKTCPHCEKLQKELETLSELGDENVCFGRINIEEEIDISEKFNITSVPTLIYFKNSEIKKQLVGYYSSLVVEANIIRIKNR